MGLINFILPSNSKAVIDLEERSIKPIQVDDKIMGKLMKAAGLALGLTGTYGTRGRFASPGESSPYDFDQIIAARDTDSYVKQAFSKYQELFWKEGFEIVGENPRSVTYIAQRFDYMEIMMGQPISDFFKTMSDQLCMFHNAVIAKVRSDKFADVYHGRLRRVGNKAPIVGYEVIPIETVKIERNAHNKPIRYYQDVEGYGGYGQPKAPSWEASEIIHLVTDRKPGYVWGTPFMTAAVDDIIALRTMEEDVQNLVHQELFPIIDVTVGSEEYPGDDEEVAAAADEINSMRHDGAIIHTERRNIKIIGSEGSALDASKYLDATAQRVAIGLGLYPHHLGMTFGGGNRSMTEQLDIALYDRIKTYQRYFQAMVNIFIINELLREGGYDPMSHPDDPGTQDRCTFQFKEIDTDTRIKKENHTIQKVQANLMTIPEGRLELGMDPEMYEDETLEAFTVRVNPTPVAGDGAAPSPSGSGGDKQNPSTGGRPNKKNTKKGTGNKAMPQNQHKRLLSPNVKHYDTIVWTEVAELLSSIEEEEEDIA